MKNDTVLKGGLVVDPVNHVRKMQDVAIRDGKIVELGENLSGERVYDVSGKAVLPGVIDMHVHVTETLGGLVGYHMAAASGVTTIIDYAGPIDDIAAHVVPLGCGMNVGCLPSALPSVLGTDPSRKQVGEFLSSVLKQGALGLKILGGHYPLTPNASRFCIEECNARKALVAWHAGSTENRSDIYGMKEAVEYAKGYRLLLAHINAYCRGNRYNYLEELRDAFQMLRDNPNIISDSHMAVDNGTSGACANGAPCDNITRNCLRNFGYPQTTDGLEQAIRDGVTKVIAQVGEDNVLLEREAGLNAWKRGTTPLCVSFPANLAAVAATCIVERKPGGRDFLIDLAATDGGGIPRNGLLRRLLCYYKLGYLTLEEVIYKCSIAPAQVFAMPTKGHLGVGADADITVADLATAESVMSFASGKPILRNGEVVGKGGTMLITPEGEAMCKKERIPYQILIPENGRFYQKEKACMEA